MQSLVQWMQKIIFNSKVYIIHKLGGYTNKEYKIPSINTFQKGHIKGYNAGVERTIYRLLQTADAYYGASKQEWIDAIYDKIIEIRNEQRPQI